VLIRGEKFAILAVSDLDLAESMEGRSVRLSSRCYFSSTAPAAFDSIWTKWLGTLAADRFKEANGFLICHAPSVTPGVVDAQSRALANMASLLWIGILLTEGVPYQEGTYLVSGEYPQIGHPNLRTLYNPEQWYTSFNNWSCPVVGEANLREGLRISRGLARMGSKRACFRIKKGLRYLMRGMQEVYPDDRIHAHMRALDAVMMVPAGESRKHFADRAGVAFLVPDVNDHAALVEAYRVRNAVEHVKPIDSEITGPRSEAARLRRATLRAMQVERLACAAYRQLATTPALRLELRSDSAIEAFWNQQPQVVRAAWPEKLALKSIKNRPRR